MLTYPIPYLFTSDYVNGASNLPHHAWTVAQPLPYGASILPDVMMRSIWVHGSYMQALERDLLVSALELQNELLGSTENFSPIRARHVARSLPEPGADLSTAQRDAFHAINGLNNQSWFFHSPLQYWDCIEDNILVDPDILATVNDKKTQSTSVNVTLRHSIVFSGKRFEERRLLAADALVITLIYLRDSPVGQQWERKAALLSEKVSNKWDIYPPDGRSTSSQLYEFQFRPISGQDTAILAVAYSLSAIYFLMSLSKLRAFKSKFGLIVTVLSQIAFSVMSSFTVCAIFRLDLSRIPRAAYPLVVLAMSLENIFRLINAVILTPAEDSTSSRIGYAFGDTAHTAIASSLQNVFLLLLLSRWVSPGVSAFCMFVAVAIGFDIFYLSTFFLSVLSVDVRRTELSDALAKASMRHNRGESEFKPRGTWELVLQGKATLSTRIAGTIIMLGFILIAQWHFFEYDAILHFFTRLYGGYSSQENVNPAQNSLDSIHQARSPKSWLRLQDHETAQEVISIIKPTAHSYVARVYEPVVFVMKGSDRMPHYKEPTLLPAVYDFINHQLTRFVVIVLVVVASVRLLTSFLLWEDDTDNDGHHSGTDPMLDVKSFPGGHALDIAMLTAAPDGHVVSVGLDRTIQVWDARPGGISYAIANGEPSVDAPFPVLAMAIDDNSKWLAILSPYKIALWNLKGKTWGPSLSVNLQGQKSEAFFFGASDPKRDIPRLVLVRRNGTLTEFKPDAGEGADYGICRSALTCVRPLIGKRNKQAAPLFAIITASRRGCVHAATRETLSWDSRSVHLEGVEEDEVHQVVPLASLGLFLIAGASHVHLVNMDDYSLVHTFTTERMTPRSLQSAFFCPSSQSGPDGVAWFILGYTGAESGDCIVQTYVPQKEHDMIYYQSSATPEARGWCAWESAKETKRHIENPGSWSVLSDGSVVGIRQKSTRVFHTEAHGRRKTDGLRHRSPRKEPGRDLFGRWEIWSAPQSGQMRTDETRPLFKDDERAGHLIVTDLGPMIQVGQRSIAFSFGNVVKLVTVGGHERFENSATDKSLEHLNVGSRRRKPGALVRPRAWS
ncbi:related to SREBP cleavage activating protein [Fusarium torulosum]|uniref:Sterol regulatory element-binding protein cleavage-activating protein n=1 Tax=Fusarium torulosum TaxID=33205 RepID=A0AAE8M6L7_9HYPO|nr:related to SREBP cleavage activating protein [Fusarium torulosum]